MESWQLNKTAQKMREYLGPNCRVILCTVSMLATEKLRKCGLVDRILPPVTLIIDEASQIEVSTYLIPFHTLRSLKRVCFVGDDRQCELCPTAHYLHSLETLNIIHPIVPPHGVEDLDGLKSIFEVEHLRRNAHFLDVQCELRFVHFFD